MIDDAESEVIDVVVEIPRGSRNKYEYDEETHHIRLDRVLYSSVHYPTDYGFIPNTLAPDGDHLDVLIIVEEPTFPGCVVPARPIGVLDMKDERGLDQKILAVAAVDPRFTDVKDLADIAPHWLREIETFFGTYKTLQGVETQVMGWRGAKAGWEVIESYRQAASGR